MANQVTGKSRLLEIKSWAQCMKRAPILGNSLFLYLSTRDGIMKLIEHISSPLLGEKTKAAHFCQNSANSKNFVLNNRPTKSN